MESMKILQSTRDGSMKQLSWIAFVGIIFLLCVDFSYTSAAPVGKKTKISFDKALPEDISNKNFPDIIDSFDYPNANILDLVKAIGKLTGLNFIVDPTLSTKKITVIAPSKITIAEAYKAFLSALAINGYTLVKAGAFWKIQETKKALKDNTEIYSGDYFPNTDQLITRIITLKYIDAKEFSNSIKYLLSQNNQISHHTSSNSVIISDYGSVIERIMKIVYTMDTPGSKESVEIIPIQHAAADDLATMLSNLLSLPTSSSSRLSRRSSAIMRGSALSKKANAGNIKISNIISDARTNSIVVSANKEGLRRVKQLVQKLDTYVDPSRTGGIYVYNVLYGTAEQVYNTLIGIESSTSASNKRSTNRRASSFHFGSSPSRSGRLRRSGQKSSPLFENVTILPDVNTNSLIISAKNKYDFERVKEVLKKIDVPRDQVFVQALIVEMLVDEGDRWEVNLANALSKGLTGWLNFLNIQGTPIVGFLNRSFSADPRFLQQSKLGPGFVLGLPLKKFLESNQLSPSGDIGSLSESLKGLLSSDEFNNLSSEELKRAAINTFQNSKNNQSLNQALNLSTIPLLQLLKRAGNVNILSTPQITALDNITASIEVGENAPVGIVNTSSSLAVSQNSVDREDVTLKLEITPRINPDSGTIQMDIIQKFDDFSERQSTASELQNKGVHIVKRNIETKMVLNDGETAVLGGLLTDKETRIENKVPVLGNIPIVGWLFKGFDVKKEKRNLIVFITPTIIRGTDQKNQTQNLLSKKLEERIYFIRKNMKGRDPHGDYLKGLTAKKIFKKDVSRDSFQESSDVKDSFVPTIPENQFMIPEDSSMTPKNQDSEGESSYKDNQENKLTPIMIPEDSSMTPKNQDSEGESSYKDNQENKLTPTKDEDDKEESAYEEPNQEESEQNPQDDLLLQEIPLDNLEWDKDDIQESTDSLEP